MWWNSVARKCLNAADRCKRICMLGNKLDGDAVYYGIKCGRIASYHVHCFVLCREGTCVTITQITQEQKTYSSSSVLTNNTDMCMIKQ